MTVFVAFMVFMLLLNDIGKFIWGWPDYEFSVDKNKSSFLNINVDMVIAMPCNRECPYSSSRNPADSSGQSWLLIWDVMGDRLFLSGGFRRDGTFFDVGQATALKWAL